MHRTDALNEFAACVLFNYGETLEHHFIAISTLFLNWFICFYYISIQTVTPREATHTSFSLSNSLAIMLLHSPTSMPKRRAVLPPASWIHKNTFAEFTIATDDSNVSVEDPKRSVHFGSVDIVSTESFPPRCFCQCSVDAFETTLRRSSKQALVDEFATCRLRQQKKNERRRSKQPPDTWKTDDRLPFLQAILNSFRSS